MTIDPQFGDERDQCFRKKRYAQEKYAIEAMKRLVASKGEANLHVYFCTICAGFHCGHTKRKAEEQ